MTNARRELAHFIKKEARTQRVRLAFKWSSQAPTSLCLFNVIFTYHSTLLVQIPCRSSSYRVCNVPRQVGTCSVLTVGEETGGLFLTGKFLGLGAETLAVLQALGDLSVVRTKSCCCFPLVQMRIGQSSRKYDFDLA